MSEINDVRDPEFIIYSACMSRVSDLNRATFNYRVLFSTIVAGYFAALSFVSGFASNAQVIPPIEVYIITIIALSLAAYAAMMVIGFLDFIYQELTENALKCAARIELTSRNFAQQQLHMISRHGSSRLTLRMCVTVSLFYFVPVACLYVVISFFASIVVLEGSISHIAFADVVCRETADYRDQYPQLTCSDKFFYLFADGFIHLVSLAQIVSAGFLAYFIFYCLWRTSVRMVEPAVHAIRLITGLAIFAYEKVMIQKVKRSDEYEDIRIIRKIVDVLWRIVGRIIAFSALVVFVLSLLDFEFSTYAAGHILEFSSSPLLSFWQ